MLIERRRSAFTPAFIARIAIAWVLVCAVLIATRWGLASNGTFPDPDDIMRLMQVRDLIAGQSWFDTTQYRVDAPNGGVPMHWSRLVDVPIALIILTLSPFVGIASAQTAAIVIVPLLTLAIAMVLCARIAWRLLGNEEATLTAMVMAISVPVLFQFGPMRIDHHGWQIVCALAAVNGLMARSDRTGGRIVGISLAFWLAISIEGLPLSAIVFAVLALRWAHRRNDYVALVSAINSLFLTSAVLFLATRGVGDLSTACDAIGPVHLAMFGWAAAVLTAVSRIRPLAPGLVLGGMTLAGGGAIALLFLGAPQCGSGAGFDALDPIVTQFWHARVLEGMPIWRQNIDVALQYIVPPAIGLFAAINLAGRSRDWLRRFWREYVVILCGALIISIFVARAGAVACVLAAPPLAWQVRSWLHSIRSMERPLPRVAAIASVALALVPTMPVLLFTSAIPATAQNDGMLAAAPSAGESQCRMEEAGAVLLQYAPGEVFAPLDIAPYLLFSEHSVIATSHHRGNDGMRFLIETSIGPVAEARRALSARGTDYVALCPELIEPQIYSAAAPDGFVASLLKDEAPEWLEPLPVTNRSTLRLWRVRDE